MCPSLSGSKSERDGGPEFGLANPEIDPDSLFLSVRWVAG